MARAGRRYVDAVPEEAEARLREICGALPDAREEKAWAGVRWRVRNKTFAHVLGIEFGGEQMLASGDIAPHGFSLDWTDLGPISL